MRQATLGETLASRPSASISRIAGGLLRRSRALSSDYLLLAVLDARNAAVKFAWMLASGLVAAILVVTAWLALVAGGIVWMLGTGASWIAALGAAALLNLIGAGAIALWMRGLFDEPPFAATLRQLRGEEAAEPEDDAP